MKGGETMQDTNQLCNRLIHEFAENYMGKLFYFCLRKTGDPNEAEDLTQDIALNVLTALEKGSVPEFFSAWVWQIARNRYSVWADEKHKRHALVTGSDASDYEIEDSSVDKTFSVRRYKSDAPDCDLLGFFAKLACEDGINKNAVGEWENVDESIEEGFLTVSDGGLLKVNAILIENEKNKELLVYIRSTADYCRLLEKMKQTVDRMKTVIEKYSNPYLEEDFDYYVAMSLMTRGFLAPIWANNGYYKGNSAQFCALYY